MRRPRLQALGELHPHAPRWGLGVAALALLATACASTVPMTGRGPLSPYRSADARGEAIGGPPRIVPAPAMSCVPFARLRSGVNIQGDAHLWWAQASSLGYQEASRPDPGDVLVLRVNAEGGRGHVAFVKRVQSSREIYVDHANWHGRGEVAVDVPVIDVSPANDWSQVRVFWVDTGAMGARTYAVEGFIQPRRPPPGV